MVCSYCSQRVFYRKFECKQFPAYPHSCSWCPLSSCCDEKGLSSTDVCQAPHRKLYVISNDHSIKLGGFLPCHSSTQALHISGLAWSCRVMTRTIYRPHTLIHSHIDWTCDAYVPLISSFLSTPFLIGSKLFHYYACSLSQKNQPSILRSRLSFFELISSGSLSMQ